MKKLPLFIICLCSLFLSISTRAQKMTVASFRMNEMDQTANIAPTMKMDQNGEKAALIKIATNQQGFSFDVGMSGIVDIEWQNEKHPGEIWLYVPAGVKRISIQHLQFPNIDDHDLGMTLKRGRTYNMHLTTEQVNQLVVDYTNSQVLDVSVTPADAEFYINGLKQNLNSGGRTSITLPFGTHAYRAVVPMYHPLEGSVTINDASNKQKLDLKLKQAFGYLQVHKPAEVNGAELYIDDRKVGPLPVASMNLPSGPHSVAVVHNLYHPYIENIDMKDSATVVIQPVLKPNYADYEITVRDSEAEICLDGEPLGKARWSGRIPAGQHTVEARRDSHRTVGEKINVVQGEHRKLSLPNPVPIYGTLEIHTQPNDVEVFVDNENIGKTDLINNRVLIGKRHIVLTRQGYRTEAFDVEIKEGQTERIERTLTDICNFTISSTPQGRLSINGVNQGMTPYSMNRPAGDYTIQVSKSGYATYKKRMRCDASTRDMNIILQRQYIEGTTIYFLGGCNICTMPALQLGAGLYMSNVNLEGNLLYGLGKTDEIYWNDSSSGYNSYTSVYTPLAVVLKGGYGITLGTRMRLTPQLGAWITMLDDGSKQADKSNTPNALGLSGGARLSIALTGTLGVSASVDYLANMKKSPMYQAIEAIQPRLKNYAAGLQCSLSLTLGF